MQASKVMHKFTNSKHQLVKLGIAQYGEKRQTIQNTLENKINQQKSLQQFNSKISNGLVAQWTPLGKYSQTCGTPTQAQCKATPVF